MKTRLTILLLITGLLLVACGEQVASSDETLEDIPDVVVDNFAVIAEGTLLPRESVTLSFGAGGRVVEVLVEEGDTVETGDVIARLEDSEQAHAAVVSGQQALLEAQKALDDLQDETTYVLLAAQAQLDLAQARDALDDAERRLNNLHNPDISYYEERVADAEEALLTANENAERVELNQVDVVLFAAQENFDLFEEFYLTVKDQIENCDTNNPDINCDVNRRVTVRPGLAFTLEEAEENYNDALKRLRDAEIQANQAGRSSGNTIEDAEENLDDAIEDLNAARRDPATLDVALREAEVAVAEASVLDAEERLAEALAGPAPEDIEIAEARIATAEASLEAAVAVLDDLQLVAPFAGTIANINLKVGEQVGIGIPVVTLADFSTWIVETDNLTEIEVVDVSEGLGATIVLDALPEVALQGEVSKIATVYEEKRGDVTYTVEVVLADEDPLMRWGMTAVVTFDEQ